MTTIDLARPRTRRALRSLSPLLGLLALVAACADDQDPTITTSLPMVTTPITSASQISSASMSQGEGDEESTPTTEPQDTGDTTNDPTNEATSDDTTPPPTTVDPSDPNTETTADATTDPVACMDPEGQTKNSACTDPSGCGCESGHCSIVPGFGGWCGDCTQDSHCPNGGGCLLPDPFRKLGSGCSYGDSQGDGCQTDNACHDIEYAFCADVFETPGGTVVRGCSSCVTDADCNDGYSCEPNYQFPRLAGYRRCAKDQYTSHGCNSDASCESGHCTAQPVLKDLTVKVCSQCTTDAQCVAMGMNLMTCHMGGWNDQYESVEGNECYY